MFVICELNGSLQRISFSSINTSMQPIANVLQEIYIENIYLVAG